MGSCDPMCSVSLSVSAGFLSPHFRFLVLFVVSLLVVVVCEVISIIGKASSKPKAPPWNLSFLISTIARRLLQSLQPCEAIVTENLLLFRMASFSGRLALCRLL